MPGVGPALASVATAAWGKPYGSVGGRGRNDAMPPAPGLRPRSTATGVWPDETTVTAPRAIRETLTSHLPWADLETSFE